MLHRYVIKLCLIVVFVTVWPSRPAQAWSRNGHMIIAAMAYRALPASLQEEYTALLHHHPDFDRWRQAYADLDVEISLGEFLFMQASIWPDAIRRQRKSIRPSDMALHQFSCYAACVSDT